MPPRAKVSESTAAIRRIPTQERGRRRVDAILEAAALVFDEVGFDAATMEVIAARSGTAIGSLYQFFPNKKSLFAALAERCLERTRAAFDQLLPDDAPEAPWRDQLDLLVDGFALLHREDAAFRAVLSNFQLYSLYAEDDVKLHVLIVAKVSARIGAIVPGLAPARRRLVGRMVVSTAASLLFLSQREPRAAAKQMQTETKRMIQRYVEDVIAEAMPHRRARG